MCDAQDTIPNNDMTLEDINAEMEDLRAEKDAIKNMPKQKHHKKVIKDINKRIRDLDALRRTKDSPTGRDTTPLKMKGTTDDAYVYKGDDKPRRKKNNGHSQNDHEKMQPCHDTRRDAWKRKQKQEKKSKKKKPKEGTD